MTIKVCGMRNALNIHEVEALGIDLMGFIFWPKSSRYVSQKPDYLPSNCKRVGVFVDSSIEDIRQKVHDYGLDIVQLHGHERPGMVHTVSLEGVKVIKAFNIATASDLEQTKAYEGIAHYYLFDTKGKMVGGNGEQFDWSVLTAYKGSTPFLLSGGIGPDDAHRIRDFHHERCIGIDLNSRFELAPALKDVTALKEFIKKIKI